MSQPPKNMYGRCKSGVQWLSKLGEIFKVTHTMCPRKPDLQSSSRGTPTLCVSLQSTLASWTKSQLEYQLNYTLRQHEWHVSGRGGGGGEGVIRLHATNNRVEIQEKHELKRRFFEKKKKKWTPTSHLQKLYCPQLLHKQTPYFLGGVFQVHSWRRPPQPQDLRFNNEQAARKGASNTNDDINPSNLTVWLSFLHSAK